MQRSLVRGLFVLLLLLLAAASAFASDHADPVVVTDPNANITDLFFFPKGDQYVVIMCVRKSLLSPPPYGLGPFSYDIYMDLHSKVSLDNAGDVARYGGTVVNPSGISPDVTIEYTLNDDASLKSKKITGLKDPDKIRIFTGVRDDPFIFPRFFGKNTIAFVASIPMSSFPAGQQDFLLWGVSYKNGVRSDHVGRSSRTQMPRYSPLPVIEKPPFVNDLPPNEHVPAIMKVSTSRSNLEKKLNTYTQTAGLGSIFELDFQLRAYDVAPDVMIYTTRRPVLYPNGRQLEDDVAHITCEFGDCILQELSFIESPQFPRATKNDKDFLPDFPYLAEPWPSKQSAPMEMKSIVPVVLLYIGLPILIFLLIIFWLGYVIGKRKGRIASLT